MATGGRYLLPVSLVVFGLAAGDGVLIGRIAEELHILDGLRRDAKMLFGKRNCRESGVLLPASPPERAFGDDERLRVVLRIVDRFGEGEMVVVGASVAFDDMR